MKKYILAITAITFLFFSCEDKASDSPQAPEMIIISPAVGRIILQPGQTIQFTSRVFDKNNQEIIDVSVVWSSDNDAIATIDENGIVTAVKEGIATIMATLETIQSMREVIVSTSKKRVLSELFTSST
ncbi:MAG: Ig-like domain-containing protein [Candidatus Marinimicrobia bacterium]|nr:Ig-like domain-containing protein [Candidatus Neomarinimicrobiota bacterium]MDD9888371.1 Ig-like domain-containing protein [Candidatus Neomarinimicrobiota bacterium]MDD9930350.1 Ig-like domain-containing protein [Candidatus Neomarinimicrobiota bacterium]